MPEKATGKEKAARRKETPARQITDEGTVAGTPYEFAEDIMDRGTIGTARGEAEVGRGKNRKKP